MKCGGNTPSSFATLTILPQSVRGGKIQTALTRPPQTLTQNLTPTLVPLAGLAHVPHGSRTRRCTPRRGAKAGIPDLVIDAVVKVRSVTLMERTLITS